MLDHTTREEILNMAQKVFAEVGFKEATVRQICKAAKANVCLISYYFGGKDGLYNAVFERVGQNRVEQMRSFLGNSGTITTAGDYRLRRLCRRRRVGCALAGRERRRLTDRRAAARDFLRCGL